MGVRVIVAGGRDFNDLAAVEHALGTICWDNDVTHVLSGEARGADRLGEQVAASLGVPVKKFPAKWDIYGRKAGPIRNSLMAGEADVLLAFWDGESHGTKHMIATALDRGLEVHVYRYHRSVT